MVPFLPWQLFLAWWEPAPGRFSGHQAPFLKVLNLKFAFSSAIGTYLQILKTYQKKWQYFIGFGGNCHTTQEEEEENDLFHNSVLEEECECVVEFPELREIARSAEGDGKVSPLS